jgi:hypothetical protein
VTAHLFVLATAEGAALVILTLATEAAMLVVSFEPEPGG